MRNHPIPIFAILAILFAYGMSGQAQKPAEQPAAVVPAVVAPQIEPIILMDFGAPWCGPCKKMQPIIKQLEGEGVKISRINVDNDPEMAKQYGADKAIPIFIATRRGRELGRIEGLTTLAKLEALVGLAPSRAKAEPEPEKPRPSDKPAVGTNGWRLRLFYPNGDAIGEKLAKDLSEDKVLRVRYGFEYATTDSVIFSCWKKLPANQLTVLLVHPDGRIIYQSHKPPTDAAELHDVLRTAARNARERDSL